MENRDCNLTRFLNSLIWFEDKKNSVILSWTSLCEEFLDEVYVEDCSRLFIANITSSTQLDFVSA